MRFLFLTKRRYTHKDLLADRFGRLFHLPVGLGRAGMRGDVYALDYRLAPRTRMETDGVTFRSVPYARLNLPFVLRGIERRAEADVVIASGDVNFGLYGAWLAQRLRVPFVYDVYDNYLAYPNNRFPRAEALFHHVLHRADVATSVSPALASLLAPHCPDVHILDNGVDARTFAPRSKRAARSALGLDERATYVGYFGSIETRLGAEVLIEAVRRVREATGDDVRLLLAGKVSASIDLSSRFIEYRGLVSQPTVGTLIAASDVVTVPYLRHPQNDYSGACKLAEYLCAERPVVATDVGRARELLPGVPLAEPGDVSALAQTMLVQLANPSVPTLPSTLGWSALGERFAAIVRAAVTRADAQGTRSRPKSRAPFESVTTSPSAWRGSAAKPVPDSRRDTSSPSSRRTAISDPRDSP